MNEDTEGTTSDPGRHPLPAEGSFVWYPKSEKPSTRRVIESFVGEIGWFLLGLAAIEAVVALFAFPASSALTSHSGKYFGGLEDAVSLIVVGPLVMVAFGVIGLVRRDWIFLVYPPAVFFVIGPAVQHADVVSALAAMFPFGIQELTSTNKYIAAAMVSYAVVYTLEHTISKMASRGRFKTRPPSHSPRLILASQSAILVLSVLLGIAAPGWSAQVLVDNRQALTSVRMPRTGDFSAVNDSGYPSDEFGLYYLGRTQQYNGSYNMRDTVSYSVIGQGATTDPKKVCGGQVRLGESGPIYTLRYETTSNGVEFGTYEVPHNTSQPPRKTLTNNEYHSCFVLDSKKYDLVRSSKYGTAYLEAYPTAKVVAAFVDANSYQNCSRVSASCSEAAVAEARKIDQSRIVKAPLDSVQAGR